MKCRSCRAEIDQVVIDLGTSPPSNAFLSPDALDRSESYYPLRLLICAQCWLLQTRDYADADELFDSDYPYFSGYSTTWTNHCDQYATQMIPELSLNADSLVVEIASNDGTLLECFHRRGIPCLGVEPTQSTAVAARERGIETLEVFFGESVAKEMATRGQQADLMAANNVLAHVPDINDFVKGFATLLKPSGVATFEFPHVLNTVLGSQFDTIYHEHYSYLSLTALDRFVQSNGLAVHDVEELPTHGGSLRVYVHRADGVHREPSDSFRRIQQQELDAGITTFDFYRQVQAKAELIKDDLNHFLIEAKRARKTVAGYGAAAKGNTLLNFAGIRADLLPFVVDRNPFKQGQYLPGSRIPIVDEDRLKQDKPDYVLVLPWNLSREISEQLNYVRAWAGKLFTAIPELAMIEP